VQTVFSGASTLPEDVYVTNTHWQGVGSVFSDSAEAAFTTLRTFWQVAAPSLAFAVGRYIAEHVPRAYQMKAYNLEVPPGERVPYVGTGTLPAVEAGVVGFPSECALVLSTVGGAAPYAPGDRGRFFIGPLASSAGGTSDDVPQRANPGFVSVVVGAAERMRATPTSDVTWVTISTIFNKVPRVTPLIQNVTGGFVDNAFDTQRRRGESSTIRETWGPAFP